MSQLRADLWLLLITIIWGSTFIVVKETLNSVGPFVFVASRFWLAGLSLLIVFMIRPRRATPKLLRDGVITGLFLGSGFLLQTIGLQTTAAGKAAFITGLNVVLVPIFAGLLLRQSPTLEAAIGVALATTGLGLMTLDRHLTVEGGDLWVLGCAIAFALHIIAIAQYAPRHHLLPFTLIQLFTVATLSTVAALLFERGALVPPQATLPAILYMGVVATAFIFGLQSWVQRFTTPTHTALIFSLEPVWAAIFGIVVAAEVLQTREWMGGALILLGMLLAELGGMIRRRVPGQRPVAGTSDMG